MSEKAVSPDLSRLDFKSFVEVFFSEPTYSIQYDGPIKCTWHWYGTVSDINKRRLASWDSMSIEEGGLLLSKVPRELIDETNRVCYATGNDVDAVVFNATRPGDSKDVLVLNAAFISDKNRNEMRRLARSENYPHFDIAFHRTDADQGGTNSTNNITSLW